MRAITMACLLVTIMFFSGITEAHGDDGVHSDGYIVDVIVVDLECDENQICVSRPTNLIEYFGADWCTECPEVEEQLNQTSNDQAVILSHKPSSSDDFWLQESRYRFLETYGLWGYPTIALDGHYILAGPTQSRELDTLLSESVSNYSGIVNVSLVNDTLNLEGDFTGLNIDVWTVESNETLPNIARNHSNLSNSNIVSLEGDKLIIVVSQPGFISLVSGSSLPVTDYSPDGGLDELGDDGGSVKGSTIIIITVLLIIICLPATIQLIKIIREPIQEKNVHMTQDIKIQDSVVMGNVVNNQAKSDESE